MAFTRGPGQFRAKVTDEALREALDSLSRLSSQAATARDYKLTAAASKSYLLLDRLREVEWQPKSAALTALRD